MEIVSRQQAIARGLHKYFTGVPCKNGHLAERYTQSSTCQQCIHPNTGILSNPYREIRACLLERQIALQEKKLALRLQEKELISSNRALAADRTIAKSQLVKWKINIRPRDIGYARELVYNFGRLHNFSLKMVDTCPNVVPRTDTGGMIFTFASFPEDIEILRKILNERFQSVTTPEEQEAIKRLAAQHEIIDNAKIKKAKLELEAELNAEDNAEWPEEGIPK